MEHPPDYLIEKREPIISLTDRLRACYTGAVYDVLRAKSYSSQTLPTYIRPLNIQQAVAGPVFTIEGKRDDSLTEHQSLLKWCELLSKAPAHTVLVCQPNDHVLAHMGELSAKTLAYKKVLGYIVDGGCRDSTHIEKLGFPVFCKYVTPVDIVGKWAATAFGEPVKIGDVVIRTGDYVLADRDGIVVIPADIVDEVVTATEMVLQKESLVSKAILQGMDPVKAYLAHGKF
jgi:4-hydroxy-4-methyl-2-oxoglutarate aldolase